MSHDLSSAAAAALATEIARIEAEITRRKQLETEIAATQAALENAQQQQQVLPKRKTKIIRRIVRRRRRPSQNSHDYNYNYNDYEAPAPPSPRQSPRIRMNRRASYAANPDADVTEFHRLKLQREIAEMHRLHQETQQTRRLKLQKSSGRRLDMHMSSGNDGDEHGDDHGDDDSDGCGTIVEYVEPQPLPKQLHLQSLIPDHQNNYYDNGIDNAARRALEEEIASLQAAIAAAASTQTKPRRRRSLPVSPSQPPKPKINSAPSEHSLSKSLHRAEPLTKQEELESEIQQMHARIQRKSSVKQQSSSPPSSTPSHHQSSTRPASYTNVLLLNALTAAAKQRDKRLQQTHGQLKMHALAPECASSSKQFSLDLAQLASQAARSRTTRLDQGGKAKMTELAERNDDDYKQDFNTVVKEAAELGRLTRLKEVIVEAVAQEKTPQQQWKSQGLLAISWQRPDYMSIIQEAANLGNEVKLPEHVVGNFVVNEERSRNGWSEDDNVDDLRMSDRKKQLLELNGTIGEGLTKVDRFMNVKRHEKRGSSSVVVKPMMFYHQNIDDVVLPRESPPKIDPKKALFKLEHEERPMIDMARYVATAAWERRARLDRPNMMPKMKDKCNCVYCDRASPFQTYAYKVREQRRKEHCHVEPINVNASGVISQGNITPSRSRASTPDAIDSSPLRPQRAKAAFARASAAVSDTGSRERSASLSRRFKPVETANGWTADVEPSNPVPQNVERNCLVSSAPPPLSPVPCDETHINESGLNDAPSASLPEPTSDGPEVVHLDGSPQSSTFDEMVAVSETPAQRRSNDRGSSAGGGDGRSVRSGESQSKRPKGKGQRFPKRPPKSPSSSQKSDTQKNRKRTPRKVGSGSVGSSSTCTSPRTPTTTRNTSGSTSATASVTPDSKYISPPPLTSAECAPSGKPVESIAIPNHEDVLADTKAPVPPSDESKAKKKGLLGKLFGGRKKK